jgi:hypothetical protein
MTVSDILQWLSTFIIAAGLAYLAFKKAPYERGSLNGGTTKSYAEAAKIAMDMNRESTKRIEELEARLEVVENKRYRITIDFTIGDPPSVGVVRIEPMLPEDIKKKQEGGIPGVSMSFP